jgi:predicted glycosyltransferase
MGEGTRMSAVVTAPQDQTKKGPLHVARIKIWIDIDNPPQVQYLVPLADAFRERGAEVVMTARDYGNALDLLSQRTSSFVVVGREFGGSRTAKVTGMLRRARALTSLLQGGRRPHALLCASRSSVIAARRMGIPSFVIGDYEYANSSIYRLTRSTILYPDVIDPAPLIASGVRREQLVPFRGLKEDISFAHVEIDDAPPYCFPEVQDDELVRVLFRPPAERSHYYNPDSRRLALRTLQHLAEQQHVVVIFFPRHGWQADELLRMAWRNEPIVLRKAVPFVPLLKGVDLVICSGGTMLREAAYLGVPAYSIFKSRIGGVDRYLESMGRVRLIQSPEALSAIKLTKAPPLAPLRSNPHLLDELVEIVLATASRG